MISVSTYNILCQFSTYCNKRNRTLNIVFSIVTVLYLLCVMDPPWSLVLIFALSCDITAFSALCNYSHEMHKSIENAQNIFENK